MSSATLRPFAVLDVCLGLVRGLRRRYRRALAHRLARARLEERRLQELVDRD